jgi:prephenate dehydrogenase
MSASHDHVCEGRLMSAPNIAIIGMGLIGASFAAALKHTDTIGTITGFDTDLGNSEFALRNGYIDDMAKSAGAAAQAADIVVLAVPVSVLAQTAETIAPYLRQGAVVMDVASVKEAAVAAIAPHIPAHCDYVPAHPIAGKSISGAAAAEDTLFREKLVILTPEQNTANRAIAAVSRLWEATGALPERMAARNHDILYGYVSHLPQLMAYAACASIAQEPLPADIPDTFTRFIRIGSSDPKLWAGIATANRECVIHALAHVQATIDHMRQEFSDGEKNGAESKDDTNVPVRYFPLLVSAALISVINQFEMQNGLRIVGYAGSGFADFTAPTSDDPQQELNAISDCYAHVARCLDRFHTELGNIHAALADPSDNGTEQLLKVLQTGQKAYRKLDTVLRNAA